VLLLHLHAQAPEGDHPMQQLLLQHVLTLDHQMRPLTGEHQQQLLLLLQTTGEGQL
jgi:hypothetical protein